MKLVREKKNENKFSIKGLTLGKVLAIFNALQALKKTETGLSVIQQELFEYLNTMDLYKIDSFGDSHLE